VRRLIALLLFLVALGCGTAASLITYHLLRDRVIPSTPVLSPERPARSVVVASVPISFGTVLTAAQIKTVSWPADAPRGSFAKEEALVGRAVLVELVPDEPILESKLAPVDSSGGLPAMIPRGKRAVSVRVNEVIGVAGFVLPRSRVDVLVSINPSGDRSRAASKLILQNVEVLAAGQKTERNEEGKPQTVNVITLLVDPEGAEKLTLASHEGELQLALRNGLDREGVETTGAVLGPMVQGKPPEKVVRRSTSWRRTPSPPETTTVEVIRGSERTVQKFR